MIYNEQQRPLYAKNEESIVSVVSISKLDMVDTLKGFHSLSRPGMSMTRGEPLKLTLIVSKSQVTVALARTYPNGVSAIVAK